MSRVEEKSGVIEGLLGDYRARFADQVRRSIRIGTDAVLHPVSHLTLRSEMVSGANVENRVQRPAHLQAGVVAAPPTGRRSPGGTHRADPSPALPRISDGARAFGFVVGDECEAFAARYRDVLTGQQARRPVNHLLCVSFDKGRTVKVHRYSLLYGVVNEGRSFDGFHHVDP